MNFNAIRSALLTLDWTICCLDVRRHGPIAGILRDIRSGNRVTDDRIAGALAGPTLERKASRSTPTIVRGPKGKGDIALVPFHGLVFYNLDFQPFVVSAQLFARTINQLAADPSVGTIVIDMDSPGGVVTGVPEAGDAVFAARQKKPVVALVNPLSASAAYWIASQATEIFLVPSGEVGSIGVYMLHMDMSGALEREGLKPTYIFSGEHKVEGSSFSPLSKESLDYFQRETDKTYGNFIRAVARGRRTTVDDVRNNFGKGRCFIAKEAKALGMVDHVEAPGAIIFKVGESIAGGKFAVSESENEMNHYRRQLEILAAD